MGLILGASADDCVNLSDRTAYRYTEGKESPNYQITIKPGCVGRSFPMVSDFRPVYWIRPMQVCCMGTSEDLAFSRRDALFEQLKNAANRKKPPVYLRRIVGAQTTPDIWTVLGGVPSRDLQYWDGKYKVWIDLQLYVYPGQKLPCGV